MAEQLIISDPKPSVQTRLRAAGLVPAGTQRSSSTRVAVSATICEYCHNKFGPFCCTQGITPFATPNCLTNLGAGGISTIDGVIPRERSIYLREPRKGDSSTALRGVSIGVFNYPCCCCCCSCLPCKKRLDAQSPNRRKSGLNAAGNHPPVSLLSVTLRSYFTFIFQPRVYLPT